MKTDIREALRYLGIPEPTQQQIEEITTVADALEQQVRPRYRWRCFPLEKSEGQILLTGTDLSLTGKTAERMLESSHHMILLGCTLGVAADDMIRRASVRSMREAVELDACGSALVEAGCRDAEEEIRRFFPDLYLTDRFSPGYSDLPLDLQSPLLSLLDAGKLLGIHLTDSCLMNPSKSVTALIGLSDIPQKARIRGCRYCSLQKTCTMKQGGICHA